MDRGCHREVVVDDDTMPPLEEEPEDGGENVQYGDVPFEEVSETETEIPSENDFYTAVFRCDFCGAMFPSEVSLIQHQNTSSHHFCFTCERTFRNWAGLLQHLGDSKWHNFCSDCEIDFPSPRALLTHLQAYPHASFRMCTNVVLLITVLVFLMGVVAAYRGGRLRY